MLNFRMAWTLDLMKASSTKTKGFGPSFWKDLGRAVLCTPSARRESEMRRPDTCTSPCWIRRSRPLQTCQAQETHRKTYGKKKASWHLSACLHLVKYWTSVVYHGLPHVLQFLQSRNLPSVREQFHGTPKKMLKTLVQRSFIYSNYSSITTQQLFAKKHNN